MKPDGLLSTMLSALYPKQCPFCGALTEPWETACASCAGELKSLRIQPPVCLLCGCGKERCSCGQKKSYFHQVIAPYYYEGVVRQGIHRYKFQDHPSAAAPYAKEMEQWVRACYEGVPFDFVTCVPLTKKQRAQREYNQSALLAQKLARGLGLPFAPKALRKLYEIQPQHTLSGVRREGNVLGIFTADGKIAYRGKTVLLVDDIKTTGATLDECAKVLKLAGCEEVYGVCLAVTPYKTERKAK